MHDFLHCLKNLTEPDSPPSAYLEQRRACEPFFNTILALTSTDFLDDLLIAQERAEQTKAREAFSRGFRLGARAMLAALTPQPGAHS